MTRSNDKVLENLDDSELDAAQGAGDSHSKWINIESMSLPVNRRLPQSSAASKGGNVETTWQVEEGET